MSGMKAALPSIFSALRSVPLHPTQGDLIGAVSTIAKAMQEEVSNDGELILMTSFIKEAMFALQSTQARRRLDSFFSSIIFLRGEFRMRGWVEASELEMLPKITRIPVFDWSDEKKRGGTFRRRVRWMGREHLCTDRCLPPLLPVYVPYWDAPTVEVAYYRGGVNRDAVNIQNIRCATLAWWDVGRGAGTGEGEQMARSLREIDEAGELACTAAMRDAMEWTFSSGGRGEEE